MSGRGGSGLGLYIAAGIVKLHQGCSLTAASPGEGQGSTFKVGIPVAQGPVSGEMSFRRAVSVGRGGGRVSEAGSESSSHRQLNILIVVRLLPLLHLRVLVALL